MLRSRWLPRPAEHHLPASELDVLRAPAAVTALRTLSLRVARRRGGTAGEWRLQRCRARLACLIWSRAARMVRACWPDHQDRDGGDGTEGLVADDGVPPAPPPGLDAATVAPTETG